MVIPELPPLRGFMRQSEIKTIRKGLFAAYQTDDRSFRTDRGAFGRDPTLAYEPLLPLFLEKQGERTIREVNFLVTIEDAINEQGKARVLDIGCGTGRFLRDLRDRFKGKVELVGVSAWDWRNEEQKREDKQKGIVYLIHDAQQLTHLRQGEFDCIVSVKTIEWVSDRLAVINGTYRILREGGYAFLDTPLSSLKMSFQPKEDYDRFVKFLNEEYGFQVYERKGFAFQKTKPRLVLPIKYARDLYGSHVSVDYRFIHVYFPAPG